MIDNPIGTAMNFEAMRVIGHRGACGHAPENTLTSISKAHELGVKWIEFDVMLAKCGEAIIIHDLDLSRTTNGTGPVAHLEYRDIALLDSGSWFAPQYAGEKIPTLALLLEHAASLNLGINVEIKPYPSFEDATVKKTLAVLDANWPVTKIPPLISSFSKSVLAKVFASGAPYPLGYVIDDWDVNWLGVTNQYQCTSLHVDHNILTQERVKRIKDQGLLLLAYTVNDPNEAKKLYEWGVDAVFSDFPDRILTSISG